jgi:hypothetical protein
MTAPWPRTGRCLCGAIGITVHAAAGGLVYCHCAQCRKTAGSAFIAVVPAWRRDVEVADPAARARSYRASPDKARWFCGACGSPLWSARDGAEQWRIRAGLFADLSGLAHLGHIHLASRAVWDVFDDALPGHAAFEPGRDHPPRPVTGEHR